MTRSTTDVSLRIGAVALATAAALAGAGCSSSGSGGSDVGTSTSGSSTGGSSSSGGGASAGAPSATDLQNTLIGGSDIPGDTFTLHDTQPVSASGVVGVDGNFTNADGSRIVTIIITYYPDADGAKTSITASEKAVSGLITGATDSALAVGSEGHLYAGTDTQGEASLAIFQEGNYVVQIEFNSKSGDAIPAALATTVAQAQDSKVKAAS